MHTTLAAANECTKHVTNNFDALSTLSRVPNNSLQGEGRVPASTTASPIASPPPATEEQRIVEVVVELPAREERWRANRGARNDALRARLPYPPYAPPAAIRGLARATSPEFRPCPSIISSSTRTSALRGWLGCLPSPPTVRPRTSPWLSDTTTPGPLDQAVLTQFVADWRILIRPTLLEDPITLVFVVAVIMLVVWVMWWRIINRDEFEYIGQARRRYYGLT